MSVKLFPANVFPWIQKFQIKLKWHKNYKLSLLIFGTFTDAPLNSHRYAWNLTIPVVVERGERHGVAVVLAGSAAAVGEGDVCGADGRAGAVPARRALRPARPRWRRVRVVVLLLLSTGFIAAAIATRRRQRHHWHHLEMEKRTKVLTHKIWQRHMSKRTHVDLCLSPVDSTWLLYWFCVIFFSVWKFSWAENNAFSSWLV